MRAVDSSRQVILRKFPHSLLNEILFTLSVSRINSCPVVVQNFQLSRSSGPTSARILIRGISNSSVLSSSSTHRYKTILKKAFHVLHQLLDAVAFYYALFECFAYDFQLVQYTHKYETKRKIFGRTRSFHICCDMKNRVSAHFERFSKSLLLH